MLWIKINCIRTGYGPDPPFQENPDMETDSVPDTDPVPDPDDQKLEILLNVFKKLQVKHLAFKREIQHLIK